MDVLLGFAATLLLIGCWKAYGWAREQLRKVAQLETALKDVWALQRAGGQDVVKDVAERIARAEKRIAEMDLTILDSVEKVAHKLQDRARKRRDAQEVDAVDDAPNDPNLLLAQARAAYPLHGAQQSLPGMGE